MKVESTETTLRISSPEGDSLTLDKETDKVYLDNGVEYSLFMKLIKQLKKERNKSNFSIDYLEE